MEPVAASDVGAVTHRSGFVAIVGRPNVGKSTLLNRLLEQKIAIVTPKPQTTRRRILGIKTLPAAQVIFVDTPGLHRPRRMINRRMVEAAEQAMADADLVLWVIDAAGGVTPADREIAARWAASAQPVCVVPNKIDRVAKPALLPLLATIAALLPGRDIVPVSAADGTNCDTLLRQIVDLLPPGPRYYDAETVTDQSVRVLVAELVREKVLLETRQEIPYAVAVTVDAFDEQPHLTRISATIHVERDSQKAIVIGRGGGRIKSIGQAARREIEAMLGRHIFLELFVRVQADWTTRESLVKEFV